MNQRHLIFDVAYTSVLKRAIKFCHIALDELNLLWIPTVNTQINTKLLKYIFRNRSWRLNERMLGALQGMSKEDSFTKFGKCQVKLWTTSFDIPPPESICTGPKPLEFDSRYAHLDINLLPKTESMKDTIERVLPFWHDEIVPSIKKGKRILVIAHLNSIRALIKHIDNVPNDKVMDIDIPTGIPLVYELQASLVPVRKYYLADTSEIAPLLAKSIIPDTECLRDVHKRVLPFWCDEIVPAIKEGNRVLIVTHESVLRALIKYLNEISDEIIADINVPPCTPLVYEFNEHMRPIRYYYLTKEEQNKQQTNTLGHA
ncbi:unnamed protein product [Hymenolepis diminuta]|uniref:phosphoglycerate mutase (2,3-diphosphoglycerate-dependent) n=1 Tax=Hymenolepis diminuta TaxID=6216 RepID=A0A0R3S9F8_HYMDI|nr:unnamed protein product [Hymenolepis diminuta]